MNFVKPEEEKEIRRKADEVVQLRKHAEVAQEKVDEARLNATRTEKVLLQALRARKDAQEAVELVDSHHTRKQLADAEARVKHLRSSVEGFRAEAERWQGIAKDRREKLTAAKAGLEELQQPILERRTRYDRSMAKPSVEHLTFGG